MRTAIQLGINGFGVLGRLPEDDLSAALDLVEAGGFDAVEVMGNVAGHPEGVATLRRRTEVAALHLFVADVVEPAELDRWVGVLDGLGCSRLILSAFGMEQSVAGYRALSGQLAAVLQRLEDAGTRLYFHCHDVELTPLPRDGAARRGVDVLREAVPDLRVVVDTYWALAAGADPAATVTEFREFSGYYHFKDGTPEGGREFGRGAVDFPVCLQAAERSAVDWVVLEQDNGTDDPLGLFTRFHAVVKR
ncbi:hypothetical protein AB0I60_27105 [Actinosynnema sp. NPDC050436]|uniref:sugar phosphate isomerase/epimerase family protein n=1 Tax=Actinosynnema sp. NPDC050436 TaxID=3155659 RepID=UPI0033CE17F2